MTLPAPLCRLLIPLVASVALTAPVFAAAPQSLFDGRTLTGWEGNAQNWRVEDGAITGEIPTGQRLAQNQFLFWQGEVADFELTAEFRLSGDAAANSGIQFRAQKLPEGHAAGYQADIDQGATWLGRLYDEHGRKLLAERGDRVSIAPDGRRWNEKFGEPGAYAPLFKPAPAWNTYRIIARGAHLEVWLNGVRVSVLDDHQTGEADHHGRLALQLHSGAGPVKVQFRNLQLNVLGRTELPPAPVAVVAPKDPGIGTTRRNGDPPLRRNPGVDDLTRLQSSPVLWHLRDNPGKATAIANPSAQKVVAGLKLSHGFQAELIAAEPDIHQPIAFAFDDRGRMWVAEAFSYPSKQPEGQGKDRIIILEDGDADGVFETKKTFIEGLNLVSGLEVGFGGVWVGAAPHLLFIPDRNGDDRPDGPAQVLLDGWGLQDTHETLNSFTWGVDGWLYGCQGVFTHSLVGKPGTADAQRHKLRAGVWRYHPVRHEFEIFAHGGSNQWGLDFNAVGHLFMTHCRSFHGGGGTSYVIRNGHYWNQANNDYAPWISNRGPDFAPELKNFLMASARYDSGEGGAGKPGTTAVYGGHSHVGTMIYLGDNWPETYRDHLFTHNLHGHQINQQVNVRSGSAYETFHAGQDVLFAPDATYLPVDLQYGPDGAVYIIDWSDTQHCHNPRTEIWDRTNGRVYRVAWAATFRPAKVNLSAKSDLELAELHRHRSEWHVRTARRLLQERAAARALDPGALAALRRQGDDTQAELPTQLRVLWTLHVTNSLDATRLQAALAHPSEIVRGWAVQLATEKPDQPAVAADTFARLAASDPSSLVRLAVASAVPALPSPNRWPTAAALAASAEASTATDRFLPKMVWFALAPEVAADIPRALDLAERTPLENVTSSLIWYVARSADGREQLAQRLATSGTAQRLRVFAFALENEAGLKMPAAWPQVVNRFSTAVDENVRGALEQLSALFGDKSVLGPVRTRLADKSTPIAERRRALDLLRRAGDTESTTILVSLLDDRELRAAVIPLLSTSADAPRAAAGLISRFSTFSGPERNAALAALTSKPALALPLLRAVETRAFDQKALTALHARQLRNLRNAEVTGMLERVWGKTGTSSADAKATIDRLRDVYRNAPTWAFDAEAGRKVYERLCVACHTLGTGGADTAKLGPDLSGTWRNGIDYFLENIVDPNAVIGSAYELQILTRRDGSVVSGMIDKETDTAVTVRTAADTITVAKADLKERQKTPISLMPTGLLEALPEREVIELLKFLTAER